MIFVRMSSNCPVLLLFFFLNALNCRFVIKKSFDFPALAPFCVLTNSIDGAVVSDDPNATSTTGHGRDEGPLVSAWVVDLG